jgi:hypothetical protein
MNEQANQAGGAIMTNSKAAVAAGALILMGLTLQWIEVLFTHFVSQNSWFFATLFGEAWNMITLWLSAAAWHQDVQYWPLLLVVTGGAILFSRGPKQAVAVNHVNQAQTGARRDA